MKKRILAAIVAVAMILGIGFIASAEGMDDVTPVYTQDFENDISGWIDQAKVSLVEDPFNADNQVMKVEGEWASFVSEDLPVNTQGETYTVMFKVYGDCAVFGLSQDQASWQRKVAICGVAGEVYNEVTNDGWHTYVYTYTNEWGRTRFVGQVQSAPKLSEAFYVDDIVFYQGDYYDELMATLPTPEPAPEEPTVEPVPTQEPVEDTDVAYYQDFSDADKAAEWTQAGFSVVDGAAYNEPAGWPYGTVNLINGASTDETYTIIFKFKHAWTGGDVKFGPENMNFWANERIAAAVVTNGIKANEWFYYAVKVTGYDNYVMISSGEKVYYDDILVLKGDQLEMCEAWIADPTLPNPFDKATGGSDEPVEPTVEPTAPVDETTPPVVETTPPVIETPPVTEEPEVKKSVKFVKKTVKLKKGKKATLKVKIKGAKKAKFSVDKKSKKIIKVLKTKKTSITVKGKKKGTAKVVAKVGKKKATCKVKVK